MEVLQESSNKIDLSVEPTTDGRHPDAKHLVYFEISPHYGSYIVTAPLTQKGTALMSSDDVIESFGEDAIDNEFGYGTDDYLDVLSMENSSDGKIHEQARKKIAKTGRKVSKSVLSKNPKK